MLGFVMGAVAGGLLGFYWRGQISGYVDGRWSSVREQLADRLHRVGERACDGLEQARATISATLRDGVRRLRASRGSTVIDQDLHARQGGPRDSPGDRVRASGHTSRRGRAVRPYRGFPREAVGP